MRTESFIREVIDGFIKIDRPFTAFDVTKGIWDKQASVGIQTKKYADMQDDIHHMCTTNPSLTRKFEEVLPGMCEFVYSKPVFKANTVKTHTSTPNNEQNASQPITGSFRTPDKRGSLTVPAQNIRAAGFKPKDIVWANVMVGILCIESEFNPDAEFSTTYKVDKDSNIRITKRVLSQIDVANNGYQFNSTKNTVEIIPC